MRPLSARLLDCIQADFPLEPRPYDVLATRLGASPDDVRTTLADLRASGVVRRMGASFSSKHLGYTSTLCALAVPPERDLDEVAAIVNAVPNVTHNYARPHAYNLWFTLIARDRNEVASLMRRIVEETGCSDALELPATALYKIRVDFSSLRAPSAENDERPAPAAPAPAVPTESATHAHAVPIECPTVGNGRTFDAKGALDAGNAFDRALVHWAQGDIAASGAHDPFAEAAAVIGTETGLSVSENDVLERLRAWRADGTVRRFGAMVRHRKMGFSLNAMTVWDVACEQADQAGRLFAQAPCVSHCYRRPKAQRWPYNLYTMVHAKSQQQLDQAIAGLRRIAAQAGIVASEPLALVSTKEYKKTSMRYFAEDDARIENAVATHGSLGAEDANASAPESAKRNPHGVEANERKPL